MLKGSFLDISGMHDLAGSTVIHSTGAWALLAGAIVAALIVYWQYRKFDITMILNGALGGLVAVTAGADLFDIYTPILVGFVGRVLVIGIYTFVVSYLTIYAINKVLPFRADDEAQMEGMDVSECGLEAYPEFKRAF